MDDLLTVTQAPVRPTTPAVMVALRERYCPPEFALFEEVGDSGSSSRVYADAVAVNMWASRGYAITGFEVKVSRSDWLRELKQPEKSEPVLTKCDYWYLVAPDDVYQADEVPVSWGILSFKDGKLREKRKSPKLDPKPITRAFVAQMFRRANDKEERDISARIAKAIADERNSLQKRIDEAVKYKTSSLSEKGEKWDRLCAELGEREWLSEGEVIQAVKVIRKSGVSSSYSGLSSLLSTLRGMTTRLADAEAMFCQPGDDGEGE